MASTRKKCRRFSNIPGKNEELESKLLELRALRNRARKRRANNDLDRAHQLYMQAISVANELRSKDEVEKLEKIVKKIELDLLLQRLQVIELKLIEWQS